jgi:hypothetical protein
MRAQNDAPESPTTDRLAVRTEPAFRAPINLSAYVPIRARLSLFDARRSVRSL